MNENRNTESKKKKFSLTFSPKVRKRINLAIWGCYGLFLLGITLIFWAIGSGRIGYVPPVELLENPIDRYASQIISSDGVMLGSWSYSQDNRILIYYNDLSPALVHGLIATEDNRFVKHSGIDIKGLMRAIIKRGLLNQKSAGGGSTISQQLAKLLFSPKAESRTERILQKPIEWVIAVRLEKYYTKEEIINLYLNKFDFLYNAVGIQSAASAYFNSTPAKLKTEEAATLIGMCKHPTYFNPVRFKERAQGRRNTVLQQMQKYGYLDAAVCDSLCQLPVITNFTRPDHKEGTAPYFRTYLRLLLTAQKPERKNYPSWLQQNFKDDSLAWETDPAYGWCNKNTKSNGEFYDIYKDGLKIYTTIDARMQQYAEEAVLEHVSKTLQPTFFKEIKNKKYAPYSFPNTTDAERQRLVNSSLNRAVAQTNRYKAMQADGMSENDIAEAFKTKTEMSVFSYEGIRDTILSPLDSILYYKSFLRAAFMAMDSRTGHVKAYVGGTDFTSFQYDMVTMGRRQIGSTMKPFVYALGMMVGFSPCDKFLHVQQVLYDDNGEPWRPRNSTNRRIGEEVTLLWALQNSSNWGTAYMMKNLSTRALKRLLESFGFRGEIEPVVSMCLGTPDISLAEMVSAYSVFTQHGLRIQPLYITHIEDPFGNTIASFAPQTNEVLPEEATYQVLNMLKSVVDGGTANSLRWTYGLKGELGGKTGTTQNHSDGWYMGFSPSLVAGCWVGGEERSIHFESMAVGQGARVALPIYALFMQKVYADKGLEYTESEKFDIPDEYKDPCAKNVRDNDHSERVKPVYDDYFN